MAELVTADECKTYLRDDSADAAQLDQIIPGVSALVRAWCGRTFTQADAEARTFAYDGSGIVYLSDDLRALGPNGIRVSFSGVAPVASDQLTSEWYRLSRQMADGGGYMAVQLIPMRNAADPLSVRGTPFFGWDVTIDGDWGTTEVPGGVKTGALIAVAQAYRNPEGFQGRNYGELDAQEVTYMSAEELETALPPDARSFLHPHRAWRYGH